MAHSFIQAHGSEVEAFEQFARIYREDSILLIDTYDTIAAAKAITGLITRLRKEGIHVRGVRLDSGNLPALSVEVREILDENDCADVMIFCSGSLDEYALATDFAAAPVDGYGIGTRLDVSADAPYIDCVYKIEEYAGIPTRKTSAGKATWPGRKQVFRNFKDGVMCGDELVETGETCAGTPLLKTVMLGRVAVTRSMSPQGCRNLWNRSTAVWLDQPASHRAPTTD
jgi:nicotinate phosphoribosyltransferase